MSRPPPTEFAWFVRVALAAVLVGTGLLKFVEESGRMQRIHALRLSDSLLFVVATVEFVIALGLLSKYWRVAARAAFVFGAVAATYLILVTLLGYDLTICGCFGTRHVGVLGHLSVVFGILFTSVALLGPIEGSSAEAARSRAS